MPTVREIRESKGWSQEELARRAIVSRITIARMETEGKANPNTFRRVCEVLGVNPDKITQISVDVSSEDE